MDFKFNVIMDYRNYRLGNLLREVNSGKIVEVIGLRKFIEERITPVSMPHEYYDKYTLEVSGKFEGEWQAEEIPLTEDVFTKIGFKKEFSNEAFWFEKFVDDMCFVSSDSCFLNNGNFVAGVSFDNSDCNYMDNHIKTLHQLQNLYFSLTGEELNTSALNPEPIPNP